jgi:hypothetical protein
MDVSAKLVDGTPRANLHISRTAFAEVWTAAELAAHLPGGDYAAGVALTCRWLAGAPAWSSITNRVEMTSSPVRGREARATPETIAEEYMAAAVEAARGGRPERAEFIRGVLATLDWTRNGLRQPPLEALPSSNHSTP